MFLKFSQGTRIVTIQFLSGARHVTKVWFFFFIIEQQILLPNKNLSPRLS